MSCITRYGRLFASHECQQFMIALNICFKATYIWKWYKFLKWHVFIVIKLFVFLKSI